MDQPTAPDRRATRLIRAIAIPLVVVGLACVLWKISDRLLWIGPLDRATFGWLVVIPIWLAAPIVAGFVWARLTDEIVRAAAMAITAVLALASAWLFWRSVADPGCPSGNRATAEAMIVPAAIVGIALGCGVTVSGLLVRTALLLRGRGRAVAVGLVASGIAFVVTTIVAIAMLGQQGCQRP